MDLIILIIFFQIIIESFPISSSGHVLLLEKFLYRFGFGKVVLPEYFDYFLHGPTILILMILFWRDWFGLVKQLFIRPSKKLFKIFLKICGFVFTTTVIAAFFYFIIDKNFKNMAWFSSDYMLLFGFFITAMLLFLLLWSLPSSPTVFVKTTTVMRLCRTSRWMSGVSDRFKINSMYQRLTLKKVLIIGLVQGMALFPGISRFASVYVVSRLLNISPRRAFQFTFLIQIPLIIPAFFLGFFKLTKMPDWTSFFSLKINFVFLLATIIGFFALWWMRQLAYRKKIGLFCFYMLIPIFVLILLMVV